MGLLDFQGRRGITSVVRCNLGPVIFGVDQRSPPIVRYVFFWVFQHGQLGAIPSAFSERFPVGGYAKCYWWCDAPSTKGGISAILA